MGLVFFGTLGLLAAQTADAHFARAIDLRRAGETGKASAELNQALKLKPDHEQARIALGIILQEKNDVAGAIAQYRQVLKRNPKSAEAHNWLGVAFMQKNALPEAIAELRRAVELKPDYVRAYNNLGTTLAQAGHVTEGVEALRTGLKHAPDDLALHVNLGAALRTAGDADGAIREFEFVLKRQPDNPEAHHHLGQALRQKGDLAGAIREFESALALNPELQESYYILAQTLRQIASVQRPKSPAPVNEALARGLALGRAGDLKAAIESLTEAVKLDPELADGRYNLGAALWYAGLRERAVKELDEAIRLNPASAEAYLLRGLAYREAGDLPAARRVLQRAIALGRKLPLAYFDLAVILLRMGQLDRALGQFEAGLNLPALPGAPPDIAMAIRELQQAIAGQPEQAEAHHVAGRLLGLAGADSKAVIAEFDAALRLRPDYIEARNNLGLVYTQIGDDEKAIAAFRQAIRLRPDYPDAHANLGAILTATDPAASIRELEKAIALQPALLKAQYNLAIAYETSPNHGVEKAVEQFRKLIAAEPNYPRARFSLGKALLRKGAIQEAAASLQQAVESEPGFGEAHYQLGLALSRAGRQPEAAAAFQRGRELIAASQREQLLLLDMSEGKAALEKGETDQAIVKFQQVLKQRPDLAEAKHYLGLALSRKGDSGSATAAAESLIREGKFQEAEPLLQNYVKDRPKSSWGWYALGYSLFGQQKIGDAIRALSKSLELDIRNGEAHKVLGRALMIIGRFDAAQVELEQGAKYSPKSAEMPYNLGKLFSIQDLWPAARRAFEQAIRLDPSYMEAYDGLGFALESLGEDAAAVANYEKAAGLNQARNGSFAAPYVNLSAYHNRAGSADRALEFARKAAAINSKSDRAWFQMAKAQERRGELAPAIESLNRAIEINPRASSYYYVLANVYRRLGKTAESRQAMEAFARLDRETNALEEKRRQGLRTDGAHE